MRLAVTAANVTLIPPRGFSFKIEKNADGTYHVYELFPQPRSGVVLDEEIRGAGEASFWQNLFEKGRETCDALPYPLRQIDTFDEPTRNKAIGRLVVIGHLLEQVGR